MKTSGFVYLWFDRKHKRYYIGSHWGSENDGYICSSRWMRKSYARRPQDFRRRILAWATSKESLLAEEGRWLSMIKPEEAKGKRYYNMNLTTKPGHWSATDNNKTVGEKISAAHRANPNWGAWSKGKKVTDEVRAKISESVSKTMTEEHRVRLSDKCSGWSHSDEARAKISARSANKTHICTCGKAFPPGPYAKHLKWLETTPINTYRELREQGLSYRKIAKMYNADHKQVKARLQHD